MSISGQNLSIVIVTLKSEKIIESCIDSLDKNIPIIVVENSDNLKFKDFIDIPGHLRSDHDIYISWSDLRS